MLSIVPFTPSHMEDVIALELECFPHGPWSRTSIAGTLALPTSSALIALDSDGNAIGYIIYSLVGDEAEILRLGVSHALRRRGTGRALVRAALDELKERGCREVFLECRASNTAAVGLYTEEGFAVEGCRPSYYRAPEEDAAVLRRRL